MSTLARRLSALERSVSERNDEWLVRVIVADEERHVIFANSVARQLLHLPAGETDHTLDGAGDMVDPLAEPGVREAVANATFEHLVGFQLTQDQLKYNATR